MAARSFDDGQTFGDEQGDRGDGGGLLFASDLREEGVRSAVSAQRRLEVDVVVGHLNLWLSFA